MAKGGKVQHWKHGWIPISAEARAYLAGTGPSPTGTRAPAEALKRSKARQAAWQATQEAAGASVHAKLARGFRFTTVDGCPDVSFKEVQELPARPPQEYREVAEAAQAVVAEYPRAVNDSSGPNRISIGFSNELPTDVMADTGAWEPDGDKIRLNVDMWDKPDQIKEQIADMRSRHWGIFALAPDLETFRRYVLTHEIGHVLHNRDEKANRYKGGIDAFADEPLTPRKAGYQASTNGLDTSAARWQLDNLGNRSAYATANRYEFFAEAFLDGTVNGDKASESGKRAVALAGQIFGSEGAS